MQNDLEILKKAALEHLNGHVRLDETEFGIRVVPTTTYAEQCLGDSTHYISRPIPNELKEKYTKRAEEVSLYLSKIRQANISEDIELNIGVKDHCLEPVTYELTDSEGKPVKKKKKGKGC